MRCVVTSALAQGRRWAPAVVRGVVAPSVVAAFLPLRHRVASSTVVARRAASRRGRRHRRVVVAVVALPMLDHPRDPLAAGAVATCLS